MVFLHLNNNKGFIQLGTEDIDPLATKRNLTVTALTQYNNTIIQCVATDFVNQGLLGDTGILLVQGTKYGGRLEGVHMQCGLCVDTHVLALHTY